jgi:hypothetical protein
MKICLDDFTMYSDMRVIYKSLDYVFKNAENMT